MNPRLSALIALASIGQGYGGGGYQRRPLKPIYDDSRPPVGPAPTKRELIAAKKAKRLQKKGTPS